MYGEPRAPLINTYKKMAQMYNVVGEPSQAMLFFDKAEKLSEELKKKGEICDGTEEKSKEQMVKEATERNQMYFQQYMTAVSAD